jgi:calcineurin-like phosphoesterase family protein
MSIAKDLVKTDRRIFVTADTHFGHREALAIFARPHATAEAMDDAMIDAINAAVGAKDILVHLGDFLGPHEWIAETRARAEELRGRIACERVYLVRGNHDPRDEKHFDRLFEGVDDIVSARGVAGVDERIVLFHYPIEQWQGRPNGGFHLHGHVHGHGSTLARRCDVGIDVAAHGRRPRELSSLIAELRTQPPSGFVRVK